MRAIIMRSTKIYVFFPHFLQKNFRNIPKAHHAEGVQRSKEHVELFIPWNMLHYSFPGVFILSRTNDCSLQHWLVEGLLIWGLGSETEYAFVA